MAGDTATHRCGLTEVLIFVAAIVAGTACSICSKTMMELPSIGIDGDPEIFTKPIFQTFGMFVGMTFGLFMHWFVLRFNIPFPGYFPEKKNNNANGANKAENGMVATEKDALLPPSKPMNGDEKPKQDSGSLPFWMYFFLAIPSIFDLGATALCMMGLQYIDVSIYQLLRGSGIIFVALMKQHVLKHRLYTFQWVGVFWNVVSVLLVGSTAILNETEAEAGDENAESGSQALLGVLLVMAGAFIQALQFVFEEKVMTMDIPSPPLLLIGMEGFWGTFLTVTVIYPLAYFLPGNDHGSYEDPFNTWAMIQNSKTIQWAFIIYFFAIFFYNLFAVLVTFMLNSVWHAILDNFRPMTVWGTDLFIFYVITQSGDYGEPWTKWSYVQLGGMFVLLYGTAVYNAPNAGSILLKGEWFACGLNFADEYKEIEQEQEEQVLDAEWEARQQDFKTKKESSFMGEMSPHVSVHTQALRGLASPKI